MSTESPQQSPALEIEGVTKTYGELRAVDDVSLVVDGGIFGLLGANGAGKSTLYRAILDLVDLDAGEIRVHGFHVRREGVDARGRIGYLPEELRLYDRLTGWELLDLVSGLAARGTEDQRTEWLEYFDLAPQRDTLVAEYSLGMRKKIGLCAALMGRPPLVLLDEPLNGLDTLSMQKLRLRLEEMAREGSTIILSSHVMAFVERICDRMAILRQGKLVAWGSAEEVRLQASMPEVPFEDVFLQLAVGA
ncbi:MAG: ABC transporter ATP-binding protein [Thermoanaerobaculia bacterium]|nr:ABC transporter ATP-binding protein [Thermoanaerobaculia bacterium]